MLRVVFSMHPQLFSGVRELMFKMNLPLFFYSWCKHVTETVVRMLQYTGLLEPFTKVLTSQCIGA